MLVQLMDLHLDLPRLEVRAAAAVAAVEVGLGVLQLKDLQMEELVMEILVGLELVLELQVGAAAEELLVQALEELEVMEVAEAQQ